MRTLFASLLLMLLPAQALASLCYAFVEDMRRDGWGVQYAQFRNRPDPRRQRHDQ